MVDYAVFFTLERGIVRRSVGSSDGRDHQTLPLFVLHRPHTILYKAQICDARRGCVGLSTGPKTRTRVRFVCVLQPSDNMGCPVIGGLLYIIGVPDIQFYQFRISATLLNGGHCVVDGSIVRDSSLGSIPLLTLLLEGQDRSTIRCHLLVWRALGTKPIGLT